MVEQGLKAVVYPELDDYGMSEFIKEFQSKMSGYVSIGLDIPDKPATPQNVEPKESTTEAKTPTPSEESRSKEELTDEIKKGVNDSEVGKKAKEDSDGKKAEDEHKASLKESLGSIMNKVEDVIGITKIKNSETFQSLGGILGKAGEIGSAIGVGATSVAEYVGKILNFLMSASPALRQVFDIIGQLVQLIWMPIGTILAMELMPMITDIAQDIGEWMGEAWEIYNQEGWVGLITRAVEMTFTVLIDMLGFLLPPIFTALGNMIWNGLVDAWNGFTEWLGNAFNDLVSAIWDWFTQTPVGIGINSIISIISDLWNMLTDWDTFWEDFDLTQILNDVWNGIWKDLETYFGFLEGLYDFFVGPIVEGVGDFIENITTDPVGTLFGGANANSQATSSLVSSNPIVQGLSVIGEALGIPKLFAEGGIVTQPTLSITGEAGPEAIIPLNQLNQVANDYSRLDRLENDYKINTENFNGGNTMNFYITGNNATEIGGEVQRILEKTVGKASSKMMWW